MSKVQVMRALVEQRLSSAVEEIFGLFERTVAEYEEELSRSKVENERQRKLLDAVSIPEVRLHRAETGDPYFYSEKEPLMMETPSFSSPDADVQQLFMTKEEVPLEQQDWSSSLDQEDPHIKEEEEELWTSQQGQENGGLEEAHIKFPMTLVKSEEDNDEEKPQSSGLVSAAARGSTEYMETEADEEDCGGPEPARNSDSHFQPDTDDKTGDSSEPQTGHSDGWRETRERRSGLKALKHEEVPDSDFNCGADEKPFRCFLCGNTFGTTGSLKRHMRYHSGEKPYSCLMCGKGFAESGNLQRHIRCHTGEKPYSCSVCKKTFTLSQHLRIHMRTHTGEKPFKCSVCGKGFTVNGALKRHMTIHTGEKPFKCSVCDERFARNAVLKVHMVTHTGMKSL